MPEQNFFFWMAASVADVAPVNPNGTKMLLANGVGTFFIDEKPAAMVYESWKNPHSWLLIFLVVPFYNFFLLFNDLIICISFISLFVSGIPGIYYVHLVLY